MAAPPADPAALDLVWRAAAAGQGPLCVAVSGGGDSLALLALLRERAPTEPLVALIVDHAIQPNSAGVAAEAAARAEALGADAEVITLTWSADPPHDHARARAGRYRALARAMRRRQARILALGHTLDDQAETALIKRARLGSWPQAAGMASFSPLPDWPFGLGLWLARPMLDVRRAALRDWLHVQGLAWRDDPANDAHRFMRARARALLAAGAFDPIKLSRLSSLKRRNQDRTDARAFAILQARAQIANGEAWFDPDIRLPRELRAFAALCAAVAGAPRAPGPESLYRALKASSATLAGVQLRADSAGGVRVTAETARLTGRVGVSAMADVPLTPGEPLLADQRVVVTAGRPGQSLVARRPYGLAIQEGAEWLPIRQARGLSVCWLTQDHLRHHLAPGDPFLPYSGAEGVQQALGLLS